MSGALKVPGKALVFGGTEYIVPPLNLAAAKQLREEVSAFLASGAPNLDVAAKVLLAALKRNYPEVTQDQVEDWIDYGNVVDVMDTVMNSSGLALAVGNLARRIQAGMNPAQTPSES